MHEMSLVGSLLDIIQEHARRYDFQKVNSLRLSFGKLSSIEPKALEFAFEILSRETPAEGATLIFDIQPVRTYCTECSQTSGTQGSFEAHCPLCGSAEVMLVGGTEELKLIEMDVD